MECGGDYLFEAFPEQGAGVNDQEAEGRFAALLAEYDAPLRRLAAVYEPDPALAEDLLQEIRLALWRALPGFRGDCSKRTFVYRVSHNRALTHVARRRPEAAELESAEEVADTAADPETDVTRRMERMELRERVAALPLGLRQVTMLVLEGLSNGEIGEVLGISEGNVAVRLVRAKQQLRREGALS
jgi:RNA polymerase sigma factor (sigma-70 family)